jgi:hypothetical protein
MMLIRLTVGISLLVLLAVTTLFLAHRKKSRVKRGWIYPAANATAIMFGVCLLLIGFSLRVANWPLNEFLLPFFAVIGVQVLWWATGVRFLKTIGGQLHSYERDTAGKSHSVSLLSSSFGGSEERFAELGFLLKKALIAAAGGHRLSETERSEVSQYMYGEEWFSKRLSRFSEEGKIARAQTLLFGRDLRKALQRLATDGSFSKEERKDLKQWLNGITQAKRRYWWRLLLFFVLYTAGLALVAFVLMRLRSLNGNPLWMPFIIAIGILLAALAKDFFFERNIDLTLNQIKWAAEKALDDLRDVLEEKLEPSIRVFDSRESVRRAASKMFQDVLKEDREDRIVIFTGAASLGTSKDDEPIDLDDERLTSLDEYKARLLQLQHAGVPVLRYVGLIRSIEGRRDETIRAYLAWLDSQIELLAGNAHYVLIDCFRAQPWGGSRSSVLTRHGFLDMVGEGEAGFHAQGERIGEVLFESTRQLLNSSAQKQYKGNDAKDREQLIALRERLARSMKDLEQ